MRPLIHKILRHSEAFFKTDMVYVAKGSFWLIAAQVGSAAAAFGLSIIFARYLTQEAFGNYKYILSIAAILSAFTLTGLGTAVTNAASRGYEGTLRLAFKESLLWSIPLFLGALGLSIYYYYQGNSEFAIASAILGITTPLINSSSLYASFLLGKKLFRITTLYATGINFFAAISIATTTYFTHNFLYVVAAYFIAYTLGNLFFYFKTLSIYKPTKKHNPDSHSLGKHFTIINLLNIVTNHVDKLLLFYFLGPINLAIYSFALAIPDQIKGMLGSFSRVAQPKFAESNIETIKKTIYPKLLKLLAIILVITISYILAAPLIFQYLFPQYLASQFYSQIMALSLIGAISSIPLTILQAHGAKKSLYTHTIILNFVRLSLVLTLIPLFGLMGAVIANIISRYLGLLLSIIILTKTKNNDLLRNE